MKNKQKARRRCALISAVLLCIFAITPLFVFPSSAALIDPVTLTWKAEDLVFPGTQGSIRIEIANIYDLLVVYDDTTYTLGPDDGPVTMTFSSDCDFEISLESFIPIRFASYTEGSLQEFIGGVSVAELSISFNPDVVTQDLVDFCKASGGTVTGIKTDYDRGYTDGKVDGFESGKQMGYTLGYQAGEAAHAGDYDNGYAAGKAAGEALHSGDYNKGFAAGQTDALNSTSSLKDMIFSIFSAPSDLINGILDFDLFGINVASLVKTLITLSVTALIVVFLIKLMRR